MFCEFRSIFQNFIKIILFVQQMELCQQHLSSPSSLFSVNFIYLYDSDLKTVVVSANSKKSVVNLQHPIASVRTKFSTFPYQCTCSIFGLCLQSFIYLPLISVAPSKEMPTKHYGENLNFLNSSFRQRQRSPLVF